jgi:hypothetical protein
MRVHLQAAKEFLVQGAGADDIKPIAF